eukprot:scaffold129145_cov42-Phaeocystis_antarctica.AAC.1
MARCAASTSPCVASTARVSPRPLRPPRLPCPLRRRPPRRRRWHSPGGRHPPRARAGARRRS